ncbi:autotransporter outer membrane beta-barrel domain-containing protein [Synergistaceae bacterium OttesenSCG-928-D05]|nr:autotransporter outer membrane beta-barrel domain-containing protein [Synergistaceae bacterium OttesenSCG-928-D05]
MSRRHRLRGSTWEAELSWRRTGFASGSTVTILCLGASDSFLDTRPTIRTSKDVDTGGLGASIEVGKRFRFGKENNAKGSWYIEPQAQITWQHMGSGAFMASNGLCIGLDSYDSVLGRVGFLLGYQTNNTNFYAKASYMKEFNGDLNINANGVNIFETFDDNWFVYGIGVTHKINDRNSLYFDLERSTGGKFEQDWAINGGWRISF